MSFIGPANHWGVVTPCSHMDVSQGGKVLEYHVLKEHAHHFEIRVGKVSTWIMEGDEVTVDILWQHHLPDYWVQGVGATEPNTTCSKRGGIAESYVAWVLCNQFMTVGQAWCDQLQEDAKICEGST